MLKKPSFNNILLIGILVLALAIRLYFFFHTSGQTLWFDEGEYMSTAKHWAFNLPFNLGPLRPPLFMAFGALGYILGLGENILKFILVLLPSFLLVYCVYLLGKEMYDERIGLIASFLTAMSWTLLFWTNRFQPDFFSMCFQVLAVFFMWKYWKTEQTKTIILAGICAAMGIMFKVSALLVPLSFMIFILFKDRFSAFKNKNYYWFSLAFIIILIPYFIWSYMTFGTPIGFSNYATSSATLPFDWNVIKFLPIIAEGILFVLFLAGFVLALKFLLSIDILIKDKKLLMDPDVFNVIILVLITAFYIFYIRNIEDRWVFLWLPFMFMLIGKALIFVYDFGKKYSKAISVLLVIGLLAWGGYAQLAHGKAIIDAKKDSYLLVKEAALWMKENSEPSDKIFTFSWTQTTYYAERETIYNIEGISNAKEFDEYLQREKPRYIEISLFENHPVWLYQWAEGRSDLQIVQAYFADKEQKQPLLIVYQLKEAL